MDLKFTRIHLTPTRKTATVHDKVGLLSSALKKLGPLNEPIRIKTITNRNLNAGVY